MKIDLTLTRTITLPDGRRIVRTAPANSFVIAFIHHIQAAISASGESPVKDTLGAARAIPDPSAFTKPWMDANAGINNPLWGAVVGTGDTAEDVDDYALAAQIAHGNGAGQLEHLATIADPVVSADPIATFHHRRSFNNNSGGAITVKEIGVYVQTNESLPNVRYFCIIRDVLDTPDTIPDTGAYQVDYTFQIHV